MGRDFVDVGNPRGPERVPLGEESTRDVDGNAAAQSGFAFVDHSSGFAVSAEPEVLVVEDFRRGEAVMEFYEVDVFRPHAGHLVGRLRGEPGATVHIGHHEVAFLPRIAGEDRRLDAHGSAEAEFLRLLLRGQHSGRGPVHVDRAHELRVRIRDHFGVHHGFEGGFDLVHRLGVQRGVVVVLDRDLRELLERGSVLVRVLHTRFREHRRHRL